jgi:hypothetical protein
MTDKDSSVAYKRKTFSWPSINALVYFFHKCYILGDKVYQLTAAKIRPPHNMAGGLASEVWRGQVRSWRKSGCAKPRDDARRKNKVYSSYQGRKRVKLAGLPKAADCLVTRLLF